MADVVRLCDHWPKTPTIDAAPLDKPADVIVLRKRKPKQPEAPLIVPPESA